MNENARIPFYKKKWFIIVIVILIIGSIYQNKNSPNSSNEYSKSKESKCSDERAYEIGYKEGKNNRRNTFLVDCDYMWKLDDDGQMSKYCFCNGYNSGYNE